MNKKTYSLEYGTVLDERYVIGEILGEGGFGITYSGENERIGLKVAIKEFFCREYMSRNNTESTEVFLTNESAEERFQKEKSRFLKEARLLSDFSSENSIVHVNDYFEANGTAYIVMSYLTGTTLKEHIKKNGPMDSEILLRKMKPLMRTLEKIHKAGLLHRDISPDNIMLLEDGSLCLIDFGAAISYDVMEKSFTIICKRSYAAPEMYHSKGELDPRADIYSLSATLYYCLTGKDPEDSLQRILVDELEPASKLNSKIIPAVDTLLFKGLSLQAEARFQSVHEYLLEIEKIYPEKTDVPVKKISKKALTAIIVAAVVVIAVAAALLYYLPRRTMLRFRNMDTEVVWLTANDEISAQDYNHSKEIIKKRLEIFAGKNNYLWEEQEDRIRIEFPVSVLAGYDPARQTRAYLSRAYNLYLVKENSDNIEQIKENALPLSREDMAEVTLLTGEIEELDREHFYLPETGDYRYFHITLTEQASETFNENNNNILSHPNEEFLLYYDLFSNATSMYYFDYCVSCGDGKSFYLINFNQEGNYIDVLNYTLTHEPSANGFGVLAEPIVNWEDPADSLLSGEYQVNESEITGQTLLLIYSFTSVNKEAKASWAHNMIAFKERLDIFQRPYAFGLLDYDDSAFVLKIRKEDAYREPLELLASYGEVYLSIKTKLSEINSNVPTRSLTADSDMQTISVTLRAADIPEIKENAMAALATGDQEAFLFYKKYPIAQIPLNDLTKIDDSGNINFHAFQPDSKNLFSMLLVSGQEDLDKGGSLKDIYLKNDSDGTFNNLNISSLPNMLKSICSGQDQLKEKMKQFAESYDYTITFDAGLSGLDADIFAFNMKKETISKDIGNFAEILFDEFEEPFSTGDVNSIRIWFDLNKPYNGRRERLGIYLCKSYDTRGMQLDCIYNQKLGFNNTSLLKEIRELFASSPILDNINTENTYIYDERILYEITSRF